MVVYRFSVQHSEGTSDIVYADEDAREGNRNHGINFSMEDWNGELEGDGRGENNDDDETVVFSVSTDVKTSEIHHLFLQLILDRRVPGNHQISMRAMVLHQY